MENQDSKIKKSNMDCFKFIDSLKEDVTIWITDPPYPFDNTNNTNRFKFENGSDNMYERMSYSDLRKMYKSMLSKSAEGAFAYVFCNKDTIFETKKSLEEAGWTYRNILVWDKINFGMGYHWRNQIEYIIYVSNKKPRKFVTNVGNIFSVKKPKGLSVKPPEIWERILMASLIGDDVIADPFAGSDPLTAALQNQSLLDKVKTSYSNILETNKKRSD